MVRRLRVLLLCACVVRAECFARWQILFGSGLGGGGDGLGYALEAVHDGVHGLIEIFVAVAEEDGPANVLGKVPQGYVSFGVDDDQAKLAEDGEAESGVGERPTDFQDQVGIGGRGNQFIAGPSAHGRVKLVVRAIRAAAEGGLFDDGIKAFSAGVGDENLLGGGDLRGNGSRRAGLGLLSGREWSYGEEYGGIEKATI